MKVLLTEEFVHIPEGGKSLLTDFLVSVNIKSRKITVKGPKGEVTKNFKHMAVEINRVKLATKNRKGDYLQIKMWFGGYKQTCKVRTLCSLITNMIKGVTEVSKSFSPNLFINYN